MKGAAARWMAFELTPRCPATARIECAGFIIARP